MSNYAYVAVDATGAEVQGTLDVPDQHEALKRIRHMGLFPTRLSPRASSGRLPHSASPAGHGRSLGNPGRLRLRIKPARLAVVTRQLATLVQAGLPLLRGLRLLQQQEENHRLKRLLIDAALAVEGGSTFSEAIEPYPKVFNRLYVNMVKAGELSGALDVSLTRLAEFLEKAEKIKNKVKAALFYPTAVLVVACSILVLLMLYIVPRFRAVFDGLLGPNSMPPFTMFIFKLSEAAMHHALALAAAFLLLAFGLPLLRKTTWGRWALDRAKLFLPVLGPLFRKVAIARFSRTLGTLLANGVPILQALTIVKDTAGNSVVGRLIATVHDNVKQGEPIAGTLRSSSVFPAMVTGMVDVGEQTGALPDMLMRIADTYEDEVDNAASALTSLLEPVMIVFLAVIVGSIVIAMFLPIIKVMDAGVGPGGPQAD